MKDERGTLNMRLIVHRSAFIVVVMLIDWIIDGLIELPLLLVGWPNKHTCPKCANRLRYLERSRGKRVQCVMCDQVYEFEKGRKLRPVDAENR